jgi:hypothetical protein
MFFFSVKNKPKFLVSHLLKNLLYLLNYPLQYTTIKLHSDYAIILKSRTMNILGTIAFNRIEIGNFC